MQRQLVAILLLSFQDVVQQIFWPVVTLEELSSECPACKLFYTINLVIKRQITIHAFTLPMMQACIAGEYMH